MLKEVLSYIISTGLAVFVTFACVLGQTKDDDVIKIDTALVNIPVIVSDRNGRNIAGLKVDSFSIFQDGEPQKIEYFANEETPLNIAIVLDTSRSTQDVLGQIKKSAKEFLKQLRPADKAMIVSFDCDVRVLSEISSDQKVLKRAIDKARIGERVGTLLRDAVSEIVDRQFVNIKGRKAMILLTDGKDAGSYIRQNELLHGIEESDTMIYSIFYETGDIPPMFRQNRFPQNDNPFPRNNPFPPNRNRSPFPEDRPNRQRQPNDFPTQQRPNEEVRKQRRDRQNQLAIQFLQTISDATAGRLYQNKIKDLNATFASIADELRRQYLLGYYPEKTDTGNETHQIRVRTNLENTVVRSKSTFRTHTAQ